MRPRVIVHAEVSLDGRIDGLDPDLVRFYGRAAEYEADAILVGLDTLLAAGELQERAGDSREAGLAGGAGLAGAGAAEDVLPWVLAGEEGQGFARPDGLRRPLLVVPDSRGRVVSWEPVRHTVFCGDLVVFVSAATPSSYVDGLRSEGIPVVVTHGERVHLGEALEALWRIFGVRIVRVDSGGTLAGALLEASLVDELSVLVEPRIVGEGGARSFFTARLPVDLVLEGVQGFEDGVVRLRYRVK